MLSLRKIYFRYNSTSPQIIINCSQDFNARGKYLIIGENGIGKSTLMDIITGFKKPVSGDVFINNVNLYSSLNAIKSLRRIISYMPASLRFPNYLEVSYILKTFMGSYFTKELVSDLKLYNFLNYKYQSLSDGYRHRVNIAVAMSRGSLVVLDEPLRSQDDDLKKIFPDFISKYSSGRTFIITSPDDINNIKWDKSYTLNEGNLDVK